MNTQSSPRSRTTLVVTQDPQADLLERASASHDFDVETHVVALSVNQSLQKLEYEQRVERGIGEVCRYSHIEQNCEVEISPARRKALPYATTCLACAEMLEQKKLRRRR
jgi:RNA polymerase-binding transcription factor DksA